MESEKPKKRPGRPKKEVSHKELECKGIVDQPINIDINSTTPSFVNVLELQYANPSMFKKIFSLFKSMEVEGNINVLFDKKNIKMYAIDRNGKNKIFVNIFGDKMNRYYTETPLEVELSLNTWNRALQTLNKDYSELFISTNRQYKTQKLTLILVNDNMGEKSEYKIDFDMPADCNWKEMEDILENEKEYPIKFTLPYKYFKKKVNDFKLLGEKMNIEKDGRNSLKLSYDFKDMKGNHSTHLNLDDKIELQSLIEDDDLFSSTVLLENIKNLAGANISDNIVISADKTKNLIFTILLDMDERATSKKNKIESSEKCQIKIVTPICRHDNL